MEIQATTTGSAENTAEQNMQVLQVLLELVHPQGGTVQIAHESDNIEIQQSEAEQLQNVASLPNDLGGGEDIVITYDSVSGEINSIQNNPVSVQQHQQDVIQIQESAIYGSQLNTENVMFEVADRQPETVDMPVVTTTGSSASADPQSTMVEIPVIKPIGLTKHIIKEKSRKSIEAREEQYQFECTLCQKLCKSQLSLEKHMRKELKTKPHVCETCNKRFKNLNGLQNHQKLHTGEKPYKCEACDIAFANRSTYNYHIELKHSDKVYVCQCSKKFKTKACLRAHLKNHTLQGPKRYKCQYCGLRLKTKHYKNEHERIHTNERPFSCRHPPCEKTFRRSGARNDHERTVHLKINKEMCKYCGHLYDKREMKNHELIHSGEKPFQCPYCELRYTQRKVLNKHIRRKHPDREVPQPPPKEKVQKYETIVMPPPPSMKAVGITNSSAKPSTKRKAKKAKSKAAATTIPSSTADVEGAASPSTVQIQVYRCMYCVKLFNNVAHLAEHEKTHIKMHHFECVTCGKTFQRPEGLTRHQGKHAGGFRCNKCGKVFNTLTKMQEHHREHFVKCAHCKHNFPTQEKLDEHIAEKHGKKDSEDPPGTGYECKYCQKSFLRKVGLKEHERIHLERVKCPLCEKVFVSYYLPKHLRTHSGDHPYVCSLCTNRHYTTPNALRTHMRRRHPVQKIRIKHKKGAEGAMIQVSEAPQSTTAEVTNALESATVAGMQGQYQMEMIKEDASKETALHQMDNASSTMDVVATSISNAMTSDFVVPIEMSRVIQQAAAANNIQMTPVVSASNQEHVTLQGQDNDTITSIRTLPQTMTPEEVSQLVARNNLQDDNIQMIQVISQEQVSQLVEQNSVADMTIQPDQDISQLHVTKVADDEQDGNVMMQVVSNEQVSQMVEQNAADDNMTIPADQQQILTDTPEETLVISSEDHPSEVVNQTDNVTIPEDCQQQVVDSQDQVSQMMGHGDTITTSDVTSHESVSETFIVTEMECTDGVTVEEEVSQEPAEESMEMETPDKEEEGKQQAVFTFT